MKEESRDVFQTVWKWYIPSAFGYNSIKSFYWKTHKDFI